MQIERWHMMNKTIIVWIRKDFRLVDNPALFHAAKEGMVVPVYIHDDYEESSMGSASKWWLHHALNDFKTSIKKIKGTLIVQKGNPKDVLQKLLHETNAQDIYWNRRYEPHALKKDKELQAFFSEQQINIRTFEGFLLHEPWKITKENGEPYKVFTAYYKASQKHSVSSAVKKVTSIQASSKPVESLSVSDLDLLPSIPWDETIKSTWEATEKGAIDVFKTFLKNKLLHYEKGRDFPAEALNSFLSPYFATGQLSARVLYHYLRTKAEKISSGAFEQQAEMFIRQLIWRDFAYQLLYHFPHTTTEPLNEKFKQFQWADGNEELQAWKNGKTGYPLVDAGMRELWETGFMHNRVRMVTASFLVKHLLIHWKHGANWFFDTLVDADLANNTMGWQWVAGSGADAAPYFRIFNPITQSEKFDKEGEYIKKWLPELKDIPSSYIHKPWEAPADVLEKANVTLNKTYPAPIVDHKAARERALEHYQHIK